MGFMSILDNFRNRLVEEGGGGVINHITDGEL